MYNAVKKIGDKQTTSKEGSLSPTFMNTIVYQVVFSEPFPFMLKKLCFETGTHPPSCPMSQNTQFLGGFPKGIFSWIPFTLNRTT